MTLFRRAFFAAVPLVLAPGAAFAHVGAEPHVHTAFASGFLHPLTGTDHLAAMVTVGLWAAVLGGRARIAVPAAFLGLLAVGAGLGIAGIALPAVETAIVASVILLGLATAFGLKVPTPVAALLVGTFALFHGAAHGAEMPAFAGPLAYGAGFLAATAALHGAGLLAARIVAGADPRLVRLAGAGVAALGLALAAG
jgi:urease accessory protein